jgi:multimeric flavodoxin WrbA
MQLAIFNGSPRKAKSNSTLLINHFLNGYNGLDDHHTPLHYLATTSETEKHTEAFKTADSVIVIFPLYTDAMPGQVKLFFENITQINSKGKKVGFIVQSGFPEAYHSIFVKRYLDKLASKLEWSYLGTIIKGGVEGIQIMPPSMTRKLYTHFYNLGKYFAETGIFNQQIVQKLGNPYRMNLMRRTFYSLMLKTGLPDYYWNKNLKENGAFDKRFDKPYAPDL